MQFSTITLAATIAALSVITSATVFTGTLTVPSGDTFNVAWDNANSNPCAQANHIGDGKGSGCGQVFTADGVSGYELVGCGGGGLTLFRNGQFNSACQSQPKTISGCPSGTSLHQSFACF